MKLYEVMISIPMWIGGDYNGSWSTHIERKQFTTEEKALTFISEYKQPKYSKPHHLYKPRIIEIE